MSDAGGGRFPPPDMLTAEEQASLLAEHRAALEWVKHVLSAEREARRAVAEREIHKRRRGGGRWRVTDDGRLQRGTLAHCAPDGTPLAGSPGAQDRLTFTRWEDAPAGYVPPTPGQIWHGHPGPAVEHQSRDGQVRDLLVPPPAPTWRERLGDWARTRPFLRVFWRR